MSNISFLFINNSNELQKYLNACHKLLIKI